MHAWQCYSYRNTTLERSCHGHVKYEDGTLSDQKDADSAVKSQVGAHTEDGYGCGELAT